MNGVFMAKRLKAERAFFLLGIIIIVAVFVFFNYFRAGSSENKIAAKVNGYEISKDYVNVRYQLLPDALKSKLTYDALLGQVIASFLLSQEAEKQGYSVSDNEINQNIQVVIQNLNITEQKFEAQLLKEGIPLAEFKDDLKRNIIVGDFLDANVASAVEVSELEINNSVGQLNLTGLNITKAAVRLQVEQQLKAQKTNQAIQTLLKQLRARAVVVK